MSSTVYLGSNNVGEERLAVRSVVVHPSTRGLSADARLILGARHSQVADLLSHMVPLSEKPHVFQTSIPFVHQLSITELPQQSAG